MISRTSPPTRSGFTLLEVSVALAILAMGLLALLDGTKTGTEAFIRTRDQLVVQALARRVMTEQLLSEDMPLDDDTDRGDFDNDFPEYRWEVHFKANESIETIKQMVPDLTKSIFLITVTIFWDDDGVEQSYVLKTVRTYDTKGTAQ